MRPITTSKTKLLKNFYSGSLQILLVLLTIQAVTLFLLLTTSTNNFSQEEFECFKSLFTALCITFAINGILLEMVKEIIPSSNLTTKID